MAEKIFWDTWAFIELGNHDSDYHGVVVNLATELQRQRTLMITTEAVLTEVGNAFSKRKVRHFAIAQLGIIRARVKLRTAEIIQIDTELWTKAWQLYESRPDKDWGHTDCMSFVMMHALGITKAFTSDHHFEQAGFTRLVKP